MQIAERREHAADARGEHLLLLLVLEVENHVGDAEEGHRKRHEAESVRELGLPEGKANHARVHVGADEAEQDAEADHRDRLEQRPARQHDRGNEPEHHQRKIFRRAKFERHLRKRRREIGYDQGRDAAGDERADRSNAERRPGAAAPRHLIAVQRGHHRG